MVMQVGAAIGDSVVLRQDYTLPDGKCIVVPMSFAMDLPAAQANNEIWLGLGVNSVDTGPWDGLSADTAHLIFDSDTGAGWRVLGIASLTPALIGQNLTAIAGYPPLIFFRVDRSSLTYRLFYSVDGYSWVFVREQTMAAAASNLRLFAECRATMANRVVVGTPWIRQGTALAVDPWTL